MLEPKIIYEDKNFLGIFKPHGMLVHQYAGNGKNKEETLVDWLLKKFPEIRNVGDDPSVRPGIVHRLDKETSGVMIIPRNAEYFEHFKNLFKTKQIKKTYLALVKGELKNREGIIDRPIGIKSGSVKRSVFSEKMKKPAVTEYKVLKKVILDKNNFSLLEIYPRTGRTHQIRVHLASLGHPVVGDKLYGGKKQPEWADRMMLHAYSLEFSLPAGRAEFPEGKRIKLEVEAENPPLVR
ncbi:MAG: RluA family pseudouridine synthase [Candidatus Liptonbacteria bacterium]|nr:RluA family pseudouridine synthase [Candidatus Liptonbacteria bacterium]